MRCEGAENPPCRRCRNTGLECLFEKPSREATLTGEAGLEYVKYAFRLPQLLSLSDTPPDEYAASKHMLWKFAIHNQPFSIHLRKYQRTYAVAQYNIGHRRPIRPSTSHLVCIRPRCPLHLLHTPTLSICNLRLSVHRMFMVIMIPT